MVVFVGLMVFYARDTQYHSTLNVFLTGAALMGSVMVSYSSARAESLIPKCDVGFLRRPERVVLLIIGALTTHPGSQNPFLNRMPAVLWILAVGSYWTFAHRMFYTWREVKLADVENARTAAEKDMAASNAGPEKRPEPDFSRNASATQ
jgi:CDP-diacylglycerol--glycerol-3-phosphate 3-phosphatidyltransferase